MSIIHKSQWYDLFAVDYCFCPSERAWKRDLKGLGVELSAYPSFHAAVTFIEKEDRTYPFVTICDEADKRKSKVEVLGLLTHEAVHVWQHVTERMREREPSIEFEAYSIQRISQNLWDAYNKTRRGGKFI